MSVTRKISFGLTVLLAAAAARAQGGLSAQPTVSGAVSIKLPAAWTSHTGAQRTLITASAATDKDATGTFQANLSITVDAATSLNVQAQQQAIAQARGVKNYKTVEPPAQITINGTPGTSFGGTFTADNGAALRCRQYLFLVNGQLYVITFTSLASKWAATYQQPLEASVATFTLGKK